MSADTLIRSVKDAGVALRVEGGNLKASGPVEAIEFWTPRLREHKAALLVALTNTMLLELPALAPPAAASSPKHWSLEPSMAGAVFRVHPELRGKSMAELLAWGEASRRGK